MINPDQNEKVWLGIVIATAAWGVIGMGILANTGFEKGFEAGLVACSAAAPTLHNLETE